MNVSPKRATEAYFSTDLFHVGMGHVSVARFKRSGETEVGAFLIDAYCLGVKNAFFTRVWEQDYDNDFLVRVHAEHGKTALSPACGRKLVEDAVAYAKGLGLPPHPDYKKACRVLGGIDPRECSRVFTFGHKGKPTYIQGPHDSPTSAQHILARLREHCGEGNYDFMVLAGSVDPDTLPGARLIRTPPFQSS